jgi:sulfopyruvate decarboxylase alpha subunit
VNAPQDKAARATPWQQATHAAFTGAGIAQIAYVPDAGHTGLIDLCEADPAIEMTVLTTEEEGIGLLAGAWLGGQRGALLMQSSGVGNCVNTLAFAQTCRFPMLLLVTMRGEWKEFNPWQEPMGRASQPALELMDVTVRRTDDPEALGGLVAEALAETFARELPAAVLIGQKLIGEKKW